MHGPSSGDKSQITLVACANTAGSVLPPMLILKGERLNHELTKGEVLNNSMGCLRKDGLTKSLLFYWLKFLKQIPPEHPVMLHG